MDRTMDDVCTSLAEQHAELWEIIDGLDPAGWDRPSLCAGWSVADVLLHMAQTEEMAIASLEGRFDDADTALATAAADALTPEPSADSGSGHGEPSGDGADRGDLTVDDFADLAVQRERGAPGVKVAARWWAASRRLEELLGEADPHQRVPWVTGRLSVVSLATTRLAECWIHTGDIAEPLGVEQVPGERLRHVARLAWRTLPYAFAQAGRELRGPVAFHLTGPEGDEWRFDPPGATDADGDAGITVVEGDGVELCRVAARRVAPAATGLRATGPDAGAVLGLVRTYA
jgi:uncharacterized protein (TIGR03084 family)